VIAEMLGLMLMSMGGVGLWTLRVTFAAQDRRAIASGTAALEAVVFALSYSQLLSSLDELHRLVGYAVGVAIGTYVGMCLARRTPRSHRRAVPDGRGPATPQDSLRSSPRLHRPNPSRSLHPSPTRTSR